MTGTESSRLPRWARSRPAEILARLVLGGAFLFAAGAKILDPPAFAHEIFNFRLMPGSLVNAAALWLPWVEMLAGLALVVGIWRRISAILLGALLLVFVVALSVNLARGRAVDCGCFGSSKAPKTTEQRLADMRLAIARDALLLALLVPILARRDGS
ncbi:MAG TPA: MauE/DoxX family redox-associated membrane protein [Thermoanaerobaculia bacterium]